MKRTVLQADAGVQRRPSRESACAVRPAKPGDAEAVARIYNHFVRETIVTFEEEEVSPREMARRFEEIETASLPWLVAEVDGGVLGFAYASKWKGRCAYRFSTEVTVYVDSARPGEGIGSRLYDQLLPELRARGIHTVIGGIALPNEGSVRLHEKFGFRKVAHFQEVGFKFDRWIDVGYWQMVL